jgi:hypothetical protein
MLHSYEQQHAHSLFPVPRVTSTCSALVPSQPHSLLAVEPAYAVDRKEQECIPWAGRDAEITKGEGLLHHTTDLHTQAHHATNKGKTL